MSLSYYILITLQGICPYLIVLREKLLVYWQKSWRTELCPCSRPEKAANTELDTCNSTPEQLDRSCLDVYWCKINFSK